MRSTERVEAKEGSGQESSSRSSQDGEECDEEAQPLAQGSLCSRCGQLQLCGATA